MLSRDEDLLEEYRNKGLKHVRQFSVEKISAETLEVYKKII